ncbi:hypothetical protein [Flavobacterium hibernum]|uniref:Uncharacterized protein n=1 Tax=Flavobacterium hibernum TaxID=37752 RepID=A0A0D0ER94_9FLAO|nr:hypothetical protein [Flavobacterium hibernum]KIO50603.1 hypothetical protein IW18_21860 [Flavobacterium hibernum]OXA87469.1 hypothetical protein B0A73_11120 [Flavobacterium hibernum]PTT05298.1 hypothetical protein DBR27_08890 [Flavobacterium sp. HMWF030]STO14339.1 Uncharacterised protein [Flavobacterium hibernum]
MKETIYKSLILSLFLTNIWSVVMFFIYFFESPGWLHGLETLIIFIKTCWTLIVLGLIVILISFIKSIKIKFKIFSLALIAWINVFLSILLITIMSLKITGLDAFYELVLILIISVISVLLIRKLSKQVNIRSNE